MLNNSTLKLEVDKQTINYTAAWSVGQSSKSSATVSILKHNDKIYLMTNAHAVANATYLKVKFNQNSTELPVDVVWNDPMMDVAILKLQNKEAEEFVLKSTNPLIINSKFQPSSTEVNAYGYPTGGKSLSFTKGHISRTEITKVAYSHQWGITVQTSAPINPGNSGGPITILNDLKQEECIGMVSQGLSTLSNVGYFIPACTLVRTIENYEKYGKLREKRFIDYVTVPKIGFECESLKNASLRAHLGMSPVALGEELTGIYVSKVPEASCAYNLLKEGDIILEIDGHPIQSDSNVKVDELENPISYIYLIQRKKYLDNLEITIQRKNEIGILEVQKINIRLTEQLGRSLLGPKEDKPLKYHIQPSGKNGAFVFVRCTRTLMSTFQTAYNAGGRTIVDNSNTPPMFKEFEKLSRSKDLYEVVVLQNILATEETDGYEHFALSSGVYCQSDRVVKVNGVAIKNLWDLVDLLSKNANKPSEIKFANGRVLVIAPEIAKVTRDELKKRYQIAFFTSPQIAPFEQPSQLRCDSMSFG